MFRHYSSAERANRTQVGSHDHKKGEPAPPATSALVLAQFWAAAVAATVPEAAGFTRRRLQPSVAGLCLRCQVLPGDLHPAQLGPGRHHHKKISVAAIQGAVSLLPSHSALRYDSPAALLAIEP